MSLPMLGAAALVGYLCGSVSFATIVARLLGSQGVAAVELESPDGRGRMTSSAVSATAIRLQFGAKWGLTVAAGDILKAFIPTLAFRLAFPGEPYLYAVGLFAVIGHNWPLYHGFRGGRGQSPSIGAMLAIAPIGAVVCSVAGSVIGFYVVRDAMVADNLGQVLYVPWVWAAGLGPWGIGWAVATNLVFFGSYRDEIRQYVALRRAGHLPTTDDTMRMMRMDYAWMPGGSDSKEDSERGDDGPEA